MIPLYIFDLDGTLADINHRLHHIEGKKKDYDSFYNNVGKDKPIQSTIEVMKQLQRSSEIRIWSGRSDATRSATSRWLMDALGTTYHPSLIMRKDGDFIKDHILKKSWYDALPPGDKERLVAIFEDRSSVVQMWRSLGLTCFQVADGDF